MVCAAMVKMDSIICYYCILEEYVRTVARSTQNGSLSGFLLTMHVRFCWFKLLSVYAVDAGDTDDLILTRNIDEIVAMSRHAKDGDGGR
jgi:hypothetical protein